MSDVAEFVLWFRASSNWPWQRVLTAPSSEGFADAIARSPRSGDWLTLPAGKDPNKPGIAK